MPQGPCLHLRSGLRLLRLDQKREMMSWVGFSHEDRFAIRVGDKADDL